MELNNIISSTKVDQLKHSRFETSSPNEALGINATEENQALISQISHNVKNPLGALLGYTDLIIEDYDTLTCEEKVLYLSEIKKTARLTQKYLERFFEWMYHKMGKVKLNYQFLNLRETITEAVQLLWKEKEFLGEIEFDISASTLIYADKESALKIFYYILENSMDYSNLNGKIIISASVTEQYTMVKIVDNGIGISDDKLNRIIDVGRNGLPNEPGIEIHTGLGLFITQLLLNLNSAMFTISSKRGFGTAVGLKFNRRI